MTVIYFLLPYFLSEKKKKEKKKKTSTKSKMWTKSFKTLGYMDISVEQQEMWNVWYSNLFQIWMWHCRTFYLLLCSFMELYWNVSPYMLRIKFLIWGQWLIWGWGRGYLTALVLEVEWGVYEVEWGVCMRWSGVCVWGVSPSFGW